MSSFNQNQVAMTPMTSNKSIFHGVTFSQKQPNYQSNNYSAANAFNTIQPHDIDAFSDQVVVTQGNPRIMSQMQAT